MRATLCLAWFILHCSFPKSVNPLPGPVFVNPTITSRMLHLSKLCTVHYVYCFGPRQLLEAAMVVWLSLYEFKKLEELEGRASE